MTDMTIVRDREAEVVRLRHEERLSFRQIASKLGMDVGQCHRTYQRSIQNGLPKSTRDEYRQLELDENDRLVRKVLEVVDAPHYLVQFGKLAKDDAGNLLIDDGLKLQAISTLIRLAERRAKILGYEAPSRRRVSVIHEDELGAELERLDRETEEWLRDHPAQSGMSASESLPVL